ncbi:unnamed protein product [Schistosoma bovis]|nr:unnamed protein product [Schistosoma bovis]
MSRRFTPFSKLPSSCSKMSSDDTFKNKSQNILPYVDGVFIEPRVKESIDKIQVGSLDLSVFSCQSMNPEAIKLAESFECDLKSLESFLKRLVSSLQVNMTLLLESISASLEFESSDFFSEVIREVIKKMQEFTQFLSTDEDCFYYPEHVIEKDDCDFIFHFTFILRYLCCPAYRGKFHGLVVTCKSLRLMVPLTILTRIIHESVPPNKLFSFLPIFCKNTESHCNGRSIAMIYQSSDIDSAARYCVSSLKNALGTGIGHSPVILVEESIYKRFIGRMESLINLNTSAEELESYEKSEYPPFCTDYINEVISYTDSVGAKILRYNQKIPHSPIIVYDITPSSVKVNRRSGPVAFVLCFRTVKESVSLLTYFIDHLNNHKRNRVNPTSYECAINIWQTDSNIIWQLFQMLLLSGVDNVFVNASSRQLAATMYTRLFEVNGSSCFPSEVSKTNNNGTLYKTLSTVISTARAAQVSSMAKGYELIQSEVSKDETLAGVLPKEDVFKYFMRYTSKFLGGPGKLFLNGKRQDTLLIPVAHLCIKPTGPIVLVIDCKLLSEPKNCTFVLRLVFFILFAGNAVVLLLTNNDLIDEKNNFLDNVKTIQKRLSVTSLISVHVCTCPITELNSILSNLCEPLTVLNMDCVDVFTKDLPNHISNLFCLSKPVTLYWSTGCNVFS